MSELRIFQRESEAGGSIEDGLVERTVVVGRRANGRPFQYALEDHPDFVGRYARAGGTPWFVKGPAQISGTGRGDDDSEQPNDAATTFLCTRGHQQHDLREIAVSIRNFMHSYAK